jgi:hypothetical protein
MTPASQTTSDAAETERSISSDDGSLTFIVRRSGRWAYVERIQPLSGIGRVLHSMLLDDTDAFDRAHETDDMRYRYPHLYWRVRRAVQEVLDS